MARQYGFALTVPGAMLLACLLVRWIPDTVAKSGARPGTMAAAGAGIVLVFGAMNAFATLQRFRSEDGALGTGPDRVIGESWMTDTLAEVTREVAPLLGSDDSLLVLPEGIMLNYQLRRRTPTGMVNFMPPELSMFEQHEIIAAMEQAPPAVVVLVKRPTDIYGHPFFGEGYGEELLAWVRANYEREQLVEHEPFTLGWGEFGAEILLPAEAATSRRCGTDGSGDHGTMRACRSCSPLRSSPSTPLPPPRSRPPSWIAQRRCSPGARLASAGSAPGSRRSPAATSTAPPWTGAMRPGSEGRSSRSRASPVPSGRSSPRPSPAPRPWRTGWGSASSTSGCKASTTPPL